MEEISGLVYLLNQAGVALAEVSRQNADLTQQNADLTQRLAQQPPATDQ